MNIRTVLVTLGMAFTAVQTQGQLTESFSYSPQLSIPDGDTTGQSDSHIISNSAIDEIGGLTVELNISGTFNGDLYVYLRHETEVTPGTFAPDGWSVLLNRPGRAGNLSAGYDDSGLHVTLDDHASNGDIHLYQLAVVPASGAPLTGSFQPDGRQIDPVSVLDSTPRGALLEVFNGKTVNGRWTLFVADLQPGGNSQLNGWELNITAVPEPRDFACAAGAALVAFALSRRVAQRGSRRSL